jgi:dihydroorotase
LSIRHRNKIEEGVRMITFKNIKTLDGQTTDLRVPSSSEQEIEAAGQLLLLPGLIDPHISLGSPKRENWKFEVESAIRGGIATILDIPSEDSPSASKQEIQHKKESIEKQFADLSMPLHYFPYVKGNSEYIEHLGAQKNLTMGSLILFKRDDTVLDDRAWDRIFQIAAWEDLPVIINSSNENTWQDARFKESKESLLEKAIHYAERQNTRLFVLNVATRDELELIQDARKRSLLIYAETTPQYLFPKQASQADFLWEALNAGAIESIGSGYHGEEQEQERLIWRGANFDFLNPIFLLPLLLTAYHEKKISLENIVRLTRVNFYDIFKLERKEKDFVLIDLTKEESVQRVSKDQSHDMILKGWPEYTILNEKVFKSPAGGYHLIRIE